MTTRILLGALISVSLAAPAVAASGPGHLRQQVVAARERTQAARIQNGLEDKELTKGERTHLRADEAAIHAEDKVFTKSDNGRLTPGEYQDLEHQLNQTSRQIYKDKHNDRVPGGGQ
jgi:uncharacterized protein HemX